MHFMSRSTITATPCITGWVAVHQGKVVAVQAVNEKREYDFLYIQNFSPSLGILLVLQGLADYLGWDWITFGLLSICL
jgi:lipopolysaccharide/colanic/teichoic acid biosynthesis glycosyltransferase